MVWKPRWKRACHLRGKPQVHRKKKTSARGETFQCQSRVSQHTKKFGTRVNVNKAQAKATRCRRRGIYSKIDRLCLCQQHRKALHGKEVFERDFSHLHRTWKPRRKSSKAQYTPEQFRELAAKEWAQQRDMWRTEDTKQSVPCISWEQLLDMC